MATCLWHQWMSRKISAMVWLTIAEGLSIGAWRVRLQQDGLCKFCRLLKTGEHALFSCVGASPAWDKLRLLRVKASLPLALNTWDLVLYEEVGAPDRSPGQRRLKIPSGMRVLLSAKCLNKHHAISSYVFFYGLFGVKRLNMILETVPSTLV